MKTKFLTFSSICVVLNIAFGMFVAMLNIPMVFLDTVGTILGASLLGPAYGVLIGLITNLILGVIQGPTNIPFALVNMTIGLVVGLISRKKGFDLKTAFLTGLLLSVVAPLVGTPISVLVFGGISGSGLDFLVGFLLKSGESIFTSAFIPRIISNIVDKPLSCIIVYYVLSRFPKSFLNEFKTAKN